MAKENSNEKKYKGKWVRITANNGRNFNGILTNADFEEITLLPVLIQETISLDSKVLELRLEKNTPTTVYMPVISIESISEDYIKKNLREYPVKDNYQLDLLF